MYGITILLVAGLALVHGATPPYVQSREAFTHTRTYLSEFLSPQSGDFHDPEVRRHYSFGILAGVLGGLVEAIVVNGTHHPAIVVVEKLIPYSWRNYDVISRTGQSLLNEAAHKTGAISDLIDNLCGGENIEQCNTKVQDKIVRNPYLYKLPAELLLKLGHLSKQIRQVEPIINSITKDRFEIPYILDNIESNDSKALIQDLVSAYESLRKLQFRRYQQDQDPDSY